MQKLEKMSIISKWIVTENCQCYLGPGVMRVKGDCSTVVLLEQPLL